MSLQKTVVVLLFGYFAAVSSQKLLKERDLSIKDRHRFTISNNFENLRSPQNLTFPSISTYIFPKIGNVCQIRLDFLKMELGQPANKTNECSGDSLSLAGAANTRYVGQLCGNLTGQHVYLDFGLSTEMAVNIYTHTNESKASWDIQVSFVVCESDQLAPSGCLQYYQESAGTIKSFNYNSFRQLNNQDYSICIKTLNGMNKITWRTCGGDKDFFVSAGVPTNVAGIQAGVIAGSGSECTKDWVMFYGVDKFCGNTLAGAVSSVTRPFLLQVHFDEDEPRLDDSNTGFCLVYLQSPN